MISDRWGIRQLLRLLAVSGVAALAVAGAIGPASANAQASAQSLRADATPAPSAAAGDPGGAIQLSTQAPPLSASDRDLLIKVRQAGAWEMIAGQMAMKKGVEPRVREIGMMIATQHVKLNALDEAAAKQVGVTLPNGPSPIQQRWLDELSHTTGPAFDQLFVQRLRAAHGTVFSVIAVVRAGTQNDIVRKLAQEANDFVLNHLTMLESTGLVQYGNLPKVVAPATGPIAAAEKRSATGGIAIPLIWLILATALITGAIATTKMIRPRSFGGRHTGQASSGSGPATAGVAAQPTVVNADTPFLYPSPRSRTSSGSRSLN